MQAFVTGGTGFLGSNLVRLLLAEGHRVKALARSREKASRLLPEHPNLTLIQGDMAAVNDFAAHLTGCDVLFHTAAYFRESFGSGDHWPMLEKINVHATIELFEAAERQGVARIVHTSSSFSIAALPDGQDATEEHYAAPDDVPNLYARSKVLGDRAIDAFVRQHAIPVISMHPAWMFGPGDAAPTSGGRLVLDFLCSRLPGLIRGATAEVVDVRDVALAMVRAAERSGGSDRFIVSGHFVTMSELAATLEHVSGVGAPALRLPGPMALGVAWLSERVAAMRGRESLFTVAGVRSLLVPRRVTAAKAERELDIRFRPLDETLRDAVAWFHANAYDYGLRTPPPAVQH